ncbi:hypothetical protein K7432_000208 [Basidiobolus ranarum]|uniref:Uncharacterized protein n=1 Tax=Basidiobolus ranarum TaxID=34480 RepID=A0ABR2WBI1_9FUNG
MTRPPPAGASSLFVNRRKSSTNSFLRSSQPNKGPANAFSKGVVSSNVGGYQRQQRIQLLDLDEGSSIIKKQEETKLKRQQDEAYEKELKRLKRKTEAEEKKQAEVEKKREREKEREEKRAAKRRMDEEAREAKAAAKAAAATALTVSDEAEDDPVEKVEPELNANNAEDAEEDNPLGTPALSESPPPINAPTDVTSPPIEPSISPQLQQTQLAVLQDTNALNEDDRQRIVDFLCGKAVTMPPDHSGETYQIVMNEEQKFDNRTSRTVVEHIVFEMNLSNGQWRKLRRKKTVNP